MQIETEWMTIDKPAFLIGCSSHGGDCYWVWSWCLESGFSEIRDRMWGQEINTRHGETAQGPFTSSQQYLRCTIPPLIQSWSAGYSPLCYTLPETFWCTKRLGILTWGFMEQFHKIIKEVNVNNFQDYDYSFMISSFSFYALLWLSSNIKRILVTITSHGGIWYR